MDPVLGERRLLDDLGRAEVKGTLLASRARYVRETWGDEMLERVEAAVDGPGRRHLEGEPFSVNWYPFTDMLAIDEAIVAVAMGGDVTQMKTFGATIAGYDLPTIYRALFRVGSPRFVLKRLGIAYRQYLRPGELRIETPDAREGKVSLHGVVFPAYFCRYGMAGFVLNALTMSGGEDASVDHVACVHRGDPGCRWVARWT